MTGAEMVTAALGPVAAGLAFGFGFRLLMGIVFTAMDTVSQAFSGRRG